MNFGNVRIQATLSIALCGLAAAQTSTIEFEGAGAPAGGTIDWGTLGITTHTEAGFSIRTDAPGMTNFGDDTSSAMFGGNLENPNSSGDFLFIPEVTPTLTISAGGDLFSFDSLRTGSSAGAVDTFEVTGTFPGGATVMTTIDAPANGAGGALTFFALPATFTGLINAIITNNSPDGSRNFLIFDSLTFTRMPSGGDEELPPAPTTPATSTSAPAPTPQPAPQPAEPTTIFLLDPLLSAQNSGFVGSLGSLRFFTPGLEARLRSIVVRGEPFQHAHPGVTPRLGWLEERWTGVIHPMAGAAMFPIEEEPRWTFWAQGGFENQDQDVIGFHPGFVSNSHLGSVGLERHLNEQLLIGFAFTAGDKDIEGGANIGSADVEGVVLDAYALWQRDPFWSSLRVGVGWLDVEYQRNAFPGVTARGETDVMQTEIEWKAGQNRELKIGDTTFVHGPLAGLKYFTGGQEAFPERGAGLFNLRFAEHAHSSLISELGWSIAAPLDTTWFDGWIQLRAGWSREHIKEDSDIDFTFETSPIVTLVDGEVVGRGPEVSGSATSRLRRMTSSRSASRLWLTILESRETGLSRSITRPNSSGQTFTNTTGASNSAGRFIEAGPVLRRLNPVR